MKKILIIDDDPMIRKYLSSLLNDNGYETTMAEMQRMHYTLSVRSLLI